MLKNLLFLLIFNAVCFAHPFDVYGISDQETVDKLIKPDIEHGSRERIVPGNLPTVKKDVETHITADDHRSNHPADAAQQENDSAQNAKAKKGEMKPMLEKYQKSNATITDNAQMPGVNIVKNFKADNPSNLFPVFYVFVGFSVLVLVFFVVRSFRLRPGAPATATVRKYGIVGRRSDMEMLPLPLAEEEDDDTLFDMGTQINR